MNESPSLRKEERANSSVKRFAKRGGKKGNWGRPTSVRKKQKVNEGKCRIGRKEKERGDASLIIQGAGIPGRSTVVRESQMETPSRKRRKGGRGRA